MATRAEILEQITDISVRVLGCDEDDVAPRARFSELGSDSLTIVEIGEELGRRFDVHLSDDTIDTMRTVQDAIDAVTAVASDAKKAPTAKTKAITSKTAPKKSTPAQSAAPV
ncbi:MAG: acyl carrier protein, partial [Aeromicrobium sp.]